LIVSSSTQQSPIGIEMNVVTSVAEPKGINSGKPAKKPFDVLFAGMVGKAAKQDSQGMAVKNGKECREDTTNAISDDEMNTVADGKSSVSDLKDLVQEMKQELVEKPAAQNPAIAEDVAVNAAVSASTPELLEKLEELLKRVTQDADPASDVRKSESNHTQAMQPIQAVINDFKHAPVEKDAVQYMKAEFMDVEAVPPVSVPELLQNIKETLAKIAPEIDQCNVKKLVSLLNELKTALKKSFTLPGTDESGNQQTLPATADTSASIAVPDQFGNMSAVPLEKTARDDNSGTVAPKSEIEPSSVTWVEYVLQQQQTEVGKQAPVGEQKPDASGGTAGGQVSAAQTIPVSKGGKQVMEQVSPTQKPASTMAMSAEATPVADRQPQDVRGANNNDFSLRSTNSHAVQFAERAANASKTDVTAKSVELTESPSVGVDFREAMSNEKFSFSDGGAQQNPGGQGGSTAASPAPAINVSGFEISVQNQGQTQVQLQPENVKIPVQEHIMNQVKEKLAQYEPASRVDTITMKLNPGELGELKINMRMEDMRLKVDIVAQNQMVKDTIMQNVDSLRDMMSRQNITIDRFDVSTGGGQGSSQAFREGRNAAGSMPYMPYDVTPASGEEIIVQKAGYWDSNDNQLVNLRF